MTEWQSGVFGDLCRFAGGQGFSPQYQGLSTGDIPFIKVSDMELPGNEKWIQRANNWVLTETATMAKFKTQPPGASVFAKIGEAIKRERVRKLTRPTIIDNNMMAAIPKPSCSPDFLYFLLEHTPFSKDHGGTSLPYLKQSDLAAIPVRYPSLPEQERIAGVLGAFDDLIETNQNLSRQMRQISEAGFKQSTEGRPLVPLGSMVELAYGKALPARVRVPGPVPVVSSAGITGDHDTALVSGPGVVVGRKGTVGSITWVRDDFYPIDTTYFAKSELAAEIVFHILQRAGLEGLNTDSAVPGLNRDRALQQLVPEVDKSLANEIASWLVPLMLVGDELMQEAVELARQRDELLPLLMSGRVRVSELEKVP